MNNNNKERRGGEMIGGLVVDEAVMMTGVGEGWSKKACSRANRSVQQ